MWQTPVFDRTLFDVQTKTAKGYINTADLNRIETNIEVMAAILGCELTTKKWTDGEFIYRSELERIRNNLELLTAAYPLTAKSPPIPSLPFVKHSQWNEIEKILYDLHSLFYSNQKAGFYCGELYIGSRIGVI